MSLERGEIIDIAMKRAESALDDGNSKLARDIINRAMRLLVHQGHPVPVDWQIGIMSKINGIGNNRLIPNIGDITRVDPSHLGMGIGEMIASQQGRGHIGNDTRH